MIGTSENRKTFTAPTKATCDEPWVKRHAENRVDLVVESQTGIDLPCFVTSERQEKIHHYKVRVQVLVYCLAELPDVCAGVQFYDAVSRLFTKGTHPEQAAKLKNLATAMHPYMGEIVPVETERECIPGVLMLHKLEADAAWAGDLHLIRPAAEPLNGQTLRRFASASFNGQSWEFSAEIATIRESSGPEGAL
jgi:hypothetical protein